MRKLLIWSFVWTVLLWAGPSRFVKAAEDVSIPANGTTAVDPSASPANHPKKISKGTVFPVTKEKTADESPLPTAKKKTLEERLDEIDQRSKILERNWELKGEDDAAAAKDGAVVTANGKDGFGIKAKNGTFQLKIGGYVQTDGRFYLGDKSHLYSDTFLNRRARLDLSGTLYKTIGFRLQPSWDGGTAGLQDAFLDLKFRKELTLRAGQTKAPIGLERLQASSDTLFTEAAFPTLLTPNYDIGAFLTGDLGLSQASYTVALLNGTPDNNGAQATDPNENKELAGRVWATPFQPGWSFLKGLGVGIAGSYGHEDGVSYLASGYKTPGQATFFSYSSSGGVTVAARGQHVRIAPQAAYYNGHFGVLGEYTLSSQDVIKSNRVYRIGNTAWQVAASYVIGGVPSLKSVTPKVTFDPAKGNWGALELAARGTVFLVDSEAFTKSLQGTGTQARRANSVGVGANWFFAKGTKLQVSYDVTDIKNLQNIRVRPTERFLSTRVQVAL